ncbi:MAG: hypothetical protein EBZ77_00565 [Chitinophagia bacterium]|nr:hypothetical protein [Chitinophagia bacterium]
MKFTVGDRVLLKRTGEEGFVTALIDKLMVEVEVNGTSFPVYLDEVDHPYLKWFTEKRPEKKKPVVPEPVPEKIIERKPRMARGVYLSFTPVFKTEFMEEVADHLKVHLLNELPVEVKFSYEVKLAGQAGFSHEGQLHAFGNIYLHNVPFIEMGQQPRFVWKLLDMTHKNMLTADGVLRIKPSKLFEHINDALVNGQPSFSYQLLDDFVEKPRNELPQKLDTDLPTGKPKYLITPKTLEPARHELDLHFEQLFPGLNGLTNDEMLHKQMAMLEKYVHLAIAHRLHRMIVIHGLGKGKLRDEVHLYLKKVNEVSRFKNEWSGKYGFGATEVIFKY